MEVLINGCCVGIVEVNVAPPFSIGDVKTIESECADSVWEEPECDIDDTCVEPECDTCYIEESCGLEVTCVI